MEILISSPSKTKRIHRQISGYCGLAKVTCKINHHKVYFFFFFFLSLKDQWTNMLGRKIHKISHQKEPISIHWLLFVHQDLCSDNLTLPSLDSCEGNIGVLIWQLCHLVRVPQLTFGRTRTQTQVSPEPKAELCRLPGRH